VKCDPKADPACFERSKTLREHFVKYSTFYKSRIQNMDRDNFTDFWLRRIQNNQIPSPSLETLIEIADAALIIKVLGVNNPNRDD
jgi:hypothetical protein